MIRDPNRAAWAIVRKLLRYYPRAVSMKDDLHQEAWMTLLAGDHQGADTRSLYFKAFDAARSYHTRNHAPVALPLRSEERAGRVGDFVLENLAAPEQEEELPVRDVGQALREAAARLPAPKKAWAKISQEQSAEIFYRHNAGDSLYALAKEFGVSARSARDVYAKAAKYLNTHGTAIACAA